MEKLEIFWEVAKWILAALAVVFAFALSSWFAPAIFCICIFMLILLLGPLLEFSEQKIFAVVSNVMLAFFTALCIWNITGGDLYLTSIPPIIIIIIALVGQDIYSAVSTFVTLVVLYFSVITCEKPNWIEHSNTVQEGVERLQDNIEWREAKHLKMPKDERQKLFANPFNWDIGKNYLTDIYPKWEKQKQSLLQEKDSLISLAKKKRIAELESVFLKYKDKKEILKIKRIWLNGDNVPWTWDAYTSIVLKSEHHYSRWGRSHSSTKFNINGKGSYTGDSKLDYINVILSDNTYIRFQIKNNPEWLLTKVGEYVEVNYIDKNYKIDDNLVNHLNTDAINLLFNKKYVPLFK